MRRKIKKYNLKRFISFLCIFLFLSSCNSKKTKAIFGANIGEQFYAEDLDSDKDSIPDLKEVELGSDPYSADTDGDGIVDSAEDSDSDGLSDLAEIQLGYDPKNANSTNSKFQDLSPDLNTNDGEKDLDRDGMPNWYESKYKELNANDSKDALLDFDKDGFVNLEESTKFSPIDAKSHPGMPKYAQFRGVNSVIIDRTNKKQIELSLSFCSKDEEIAISLSQSVHPDDQTFIPCIQNKFTALAPLEFTKEGLQNVYIWRKVNGFLRPYPAIATLEYDITPPQGTASITQTTNNSVTLRHHKPSDNDYHQLEIHRFESESCKNTENQLGIKLTTTPNTSEILDQNLASGIRYCYKIQWTDTLGNQHIEEKIIETPFPNFTVYDDDQETSGKTNNSSLRVTMNQCDGIDKVLFSASNTQPQPNDPGFLICTMDHLGISFNALTNQSTGLVNDIEIYMWTLKDGKISNLSSKKTITYDTLAPTGVLQEQSTSSNSISLSVQHPTDTDYNDLKIYRFTGQNCSSSDIVSGVIVTANTLSTSITDTNLLPGFDYCYKSIWRDNVGNQSITTLNSKTVAENFNAFDNDYNTANKTNSQQVRISMNSCEGIDKVLLSESSTIPLSTDSSFQICNTNALGLTFNALSTQNQGLSTSATINLWTLKNGTVSHNSRSKIINYDTLAPTGALSINAQTTYSITITLNHPNDSDYHSLELYRFLGVDCIASDVANATQLSVTTSSTNFADSNLSPGFDYCYKAIWKDDVGNLSTSSINTNTNALDFKVFDNDYATENKTNSTSVRTTIESCAGIDKVIVTNSSTKPSINDVNFKNCITTPMGLIFTPLIAQASDLESTQDLYLWITKTGIVSDYYKKVSINYDTKSPIGSIIHPNANIVIATIDTNITNPIDTDYTSLQFYHKKDLGSGCAITTKESADSQIVSDYNSKAIVNGNSGQTNNYVLGPYNNNEKHCFKAYFIDNVGNEGSIATEYEIDGISTCNILSPSDNTNRYSWYENTLASYSFSCDGVVNDVANYQNNWPTVFTLSTLPNTSFTLSKDAISTSALTSWSLNIKGQTGVADTAINNVKYKVVALPEADHVNYIDPTLITLQDTLNAEAEFKFNLDLNYAGNSHSLKMLLQSAGNTATTSNGVASTSDSDIPLLEYSDNAATCNGTLDAPTLCVNPYSFTPANFGSSQPPYLTSMTELFWDYDWYDHGEYQIKVKNLLYLGNNRIDNHLATLKYDNVDVGNEPKMLTDTKLLNSNSTGSTTWPDTIPSIAFNNALSSSSKQVIATRFGQYDTTAKQSAGILTIDRESSPVMTKHFFDLSLASDYTTSNTKTSTLVSSSSNYWISAGIHNTGTTLDFSVLTTTSVGSLINIGSTHTFSSVQLTPAFFDQDSIYRHGLLFFANNGSGSQELFLSKIKSEPTTFTKDNFFDSTSFYDSNAFFHNVPAISLGVAPTATIKNAKIAYGQISDEGANFYVAWRQNSSSNLSVKSVSSSQTFPQNQSSVVNLNVLTTTLNPSIGLNTFSLAVGQDIKNNGKCILAIIYTNNTNKTCNLEVLNCETSGALTSMSTHTSILSSTDCRFPQMHYDSNSKQFLASAIDKQNNKILIKQFQYDSTQSGDAKIFNQKVSTARNIPNDTNSCFLGTDYNSTLKRLAIVSIENESSLTDCSIGNGSIYLDFYKIR